MNEQVENTEVLETALDGNGVTSEQEQVNEFNANMFANMHQNLEETSNVENDYEESDVEESNINPGGFETTDDLGDDGFFWSSDEPEETEEVVENTEQLDIPETSQIEQTQQTEAIDWSEIGRQVGLNVNNQSEFISALNSTKSNQKEYDPRVEAIQSALDQGMDFQTIINGGNKFTELLSKSAEEKIRWNLEQEGLDQETINDFINTYQINNTLNLEAKRVDAKIKRMSEREVHLQSQRAAEEQQSYQHEVDSNRTELRGELSKTIELFGGKLGRNDTDLSKNRDKIYDYIVSGKIYEFQDHRDVIEFAFFKMNKDKIINLIKNIGKEQGKSQVLDNMKHVDLGKNGRSNMPVTRPGSFNPSEFSKF